MKDKIEFLVYKFFIDSKDFNGIPVRNISRILEINYEDSIDVIKELVSEDLISIQSSSNPHIIGFQHYPISIQIKILEDAKVNTFSTQEYGKIKFETESSEFPICLYPSQKSLIQKRDLSKYQNAEYTKQLALAEPQLKPIFFEIEVLERYFNDPRFDFKFEDYSGKISCKYDENGYPIVRKEDQVFLKTFGLGFDSQGNRLAVAYLCYLQHLTDEHQAYWKNKQVIEDCKVLEEYYENTILGNWSFSHSIFSAFIGELNCINDLTQTIFDKKLFLRSFNSDNRPKEFTIFFIPTSKNYEEFIAISDKMISENINKDFFKSSVDLFEIRVSADNLREKIHKGTLMLLEEWLLKYYKTNNKDDIKNLLLPFRKIRKERQNPAHKINENIYDKKYIDKQREIISQTYSSIRNLRQIFQEHIKAKDFKIPKWLDEGIVKNF